MSFTKAAVELHVTPAAISLAEQSELHAIPADKALLALQHAPKRVA